ncbi:MAG TPA: TonB-dependent receptor plug domain-containing protein, partial [Kofleriaceae bacterium]
MAVVLVFSGLAAAESDRVLRGVVVNEDTSAAIEGALVIGQQDTAITDQDGGFALVIGADEHYLVVSAPGFAMRSIEVENAARVELSVSHEVIEVQGTAPRPVQPKPPPPRPPPERPAAQSYQLSAADLRVLPGTANDALRAAQVLPGVARLPYSFGGIVMRGTSPRDNVVYLDGIEVPLAFHFGGISSFYPSSMLEGISVSNGGIDASYGRAQGG